MEFYADFSKYNDRTAVIADEGSVLSYRELAEFTRQIGAVVPARSLLFALCENSVGSLAGCMAFLNNRLVPLLLDAELDRQLLNRLLAVYQPEFLYLPTRFRSEFLSYTVLHEAYDYVLLQTEYTARAALHDDLALLLTTSGSTGSPKLVRLSYDNLRSNGEAIAEYLQLDANERPITTLPMHYSYGFSILNSHLLVGATILLTQKSLVEKGFWAFFQKEMATSFGGVPYTYEMLKRLRFFRLELPSLRTLTQAGGKLSIELTKEFAAYSEQQGIRFIVMYGQTEATARMSYLPPEYSISKCGSIGMAIPLGQLFLVDENGLVIEENGQEGELAYRGANVSLGYAECREDLELGDARKGVLFTGDMARCDADGFYYITGRKKRFIKLFGNRINLDEVEHLLKDIVTDCACCGSDDHMMIYITEVGRADDLRQLMVRKTGIHPSAFSVKVIPEIPKNEAGKTLYADLICWVV